MGDEARPIGPDDLRAVLKQRNRLELEERLGVTCWERVLRWAVTNPAARRTQAELAKLWRIRQPSVSQTLQQLTAAGAVEALPHSGREPIQCLLTGMTRLAT
ncbi:MAG: MarR family transcriptional regulator [Synechococcus sp. SB0666_bin_14]|nr:MarR family transcriptional regulator [Synechococcus sp. SB0666_bin_14]MYA90334.1 MarR family transcriptional regulator [Synechococcus sp. SB0663_bin_10]MYG47021.1 MarR family transcriptional regulator [Synechococcus sp. SB0675_bin_6]MYJ59318.1 MarR family transcriptional regulator [Synechococcus sp. SB0672_bin_6]